MPNLAPYLAALPAVVASLQVLFTLFGNGLERRLTKHLDMLKKTPTGSEAHQSLSALIDMEAKELHSKLENRLRRKINWATVGTMAVVLMVATPLAWFLWTSGGGWPSPWSVIAQTISVAVALFATLLVTVGGGQQIWASPDK